MNAIRISKSQIDSFKRICKLFSRASRNLINLPDRGYQLYNAIAGILGHNTFNTLFETAKQCSQGKFSVYDMQTYLIDFLVVKTEADHVFASRLVEKVFSQYEVNLFEKTVTEYWVDGFNAKSIALETILYFKKNQSKIHNYFKDFSFPNPEASGFLTASNLKFADLSKFECELIIDTLSYAGWYGSNGEDFELYPFTIRHAESDLANQLYCLKKECDLAKSKPYTANGHLRDKLSGIVIYGYLTFISSGQFLYLLREFEQHEASNVKKNPEDEEKSANDLLENLGNFIDLLDQEGIKLIEISPNNRLKPDLISTLMIEKGFMRVGDKFIRYLNEAA